MRWEDERYVRLYTRDTPEFLALTWQARGLFALILRKVDRAGVLALGRLGLRGVAVAVGAPYVDIEPHLRELIDDGCIVFDEEKAAIFMPNFLAAQETPMSDRARQKASRERAQAEFGGSKAASSRARRTVTKRDDMPSQNVTPVDHQSQDVTPASQNVTDCHEVSRNPPPPPLCAVPSRAEPSDPIQEITAAPPAEDHAVATSRNVTPDKTPDPEDFAAWAAHVTALAESKRRDNGIAPPVAISAADFQILEGKKP